MGCHSFFQSIFPTQGSNPDHPSCRQILYCVIQGSSQKKQWNAKNKKKSTSATLTMLKPLTGWITTNCKIPKEMRIPVHLNCLLRNLYAGQEATVRTGHGKWTGTKLKKGVCQSCKLSPCLCKLYAEDIMCNAGLENSQARIKIAGRNSNSSDMKMMPL